MRLHGITFVHHARRRLVRSAAAVAVVTALLGASTDTVSASGNNGATQVSGVADFSDPTCPGLRLHPTTEGWSLDGCLQIVEFDREKWNPSGSYQEEGRESFDGDLFVDGQSVGSGTFETTYQFRGKFGEIMNFDTEIFGRCQHPIVSGTGVFASVEGRLDFKDVLEGPGAPFFPYRGHLKV